MPERKRDRNGFLIFDSPKRKTQPRDPCAEDMHSFVYDGDSPCGYFVVRKCRWCGKRVEIDKEDLLVRR